MGALPGQNHCVIPHAPCWGEGVRRASTPKRRVVTKKAGTDVCLRVQPRHRGWPTVTPWLCSSSPARRGSLDQVEKDSAALEGALTESGDLQRLIASPVVRREEQGRAVGSLAERLGLAPLTGNFLGVLARQRRLFTLPGIIKRFTRPPGRRAR